MTQPTIPVPPTPVPPAPEPQDTRATHPVNVLHLVSGLIFLGVAGLWALRAADVIEPDGMPWMIPLILVGAGAAGLLASLAKGIGRSTVEHNDPRDST